MKKNNFVGRFLEEFHRGRLIFPFLSILMLSYVVLCGWMMVDLFYLSGREITADEYETVATMVQTEPELKSTVDECMEDGIIVRVEFENIRGKYLDLAKSKLK
jgi:hypothetical protein